GTDTKKYTLNLLPGANNIRAVALNSQRTESEPDEILVNYNSGAQANTPPVLNNGATGPVATVDKDATMHLVVVGINAYKNPKMSLNYALADATAFKNEAEKDAKTITTNLKTYFVTDAQADKNGITAAFAEVQKNAKPQDVFVFYYAGHGVISDKNKEFYLVPTDVTDLQNVDEALAQSGIPSKMLQRYAIDIPAQKQVFILDACQSAGAFQQLMSNDANQQKNLAVVARSTGTHWIAASGSQQFAQEFGQLGHGAFTYVLLKAMQGEAANNKMITVNGLKNYLQTQVPDLMKKYNGAPQYPASYGFGNDFPVELMK
ncbi:caspase family protein, partial [Mucilaginibacter pedocola]|uniref:caspase family protein n=1 Tax=Mucilaginibacter pedocola TaxID=1792845 RepID=UPI001EE3B4EF